MKVDNIMTNKNNWAYIWVCHLLTTATPVEKLPFGWCVYCEAVEFED